MALASGPGCGHADCWMLGLGCKDQATTFRNQETPPFNFEKVKDIFEEIERRASEPRLNQIVHNDCQDFFDLLSDKHPLEYRNLLSMGIPVRESGIIPRRQVQFFDQYGKPLLIFTMPPKTV